MEQEQKRIQALRSTLTRFIHSRSRRVLKTYLEEIGSAAEKVLDAQLTILKEANESLDSLTKDEAKLDNLLQLCNQISKTKDLLPASERQNQAETLSKTIRERIARQKFDDSDPLKQQNQKEELFEALSYVLKENIDLNKSDHVVVNETRILVEDIIGCVRITKSDVLNSAVETYLDHYKGEQENVWRVFECLPRYYTLKYAQKRLVYLLNTQDYDAILRSDCLRVLQAMDIKDNMYVNAVLTETITSINRLTRPSLHDSLPKIDKIVQRFANTNAQKVWQAHCQSYYTNLLRCVLADREYAKAHKHLLPDPDNLLGCYLLINAPEFRTICEEALKRYKGQEWIWIDNENDGKQAWIWIDNENDGLQILVKLLIDKDNKYILIPKFEMEDLKSRIKALIKEGTMGQQIIRYLQNINATSIAQGLMRQVFLNPEVDKTIKDAVAIELLDYFKKLLFKKERELLAQFCLAVDKAGLSMEYRFAILLLRFGEIDNFVKNASVSFESLSKKKIMQLPELNEFLLTIMEEVIDPFVKRSWLSYLEIFLLPGIRNGEYDPRLSTALESLYKVLKGSASEEDRQNIIDYGKYVKRINKPNQSSAANTSIHNTENVRLFSRDTKEEVSLNADNNSFEPAEETLQGLEDSFK